MTPAFCSGCRTELAPFALACPACGALVHAPRLKALAASAAVASESGDLPGSRQRLTDMLTLLPPRSQQYRTIRERIDDLTRRIDAPTVEDVLTVEAPSPSGDARPWWKRGAGGVIAVAALLVGKLKFLLLGLMKAGTLVSMFAFFAVYWSTYGWPLALGLVLSIYIHEMGHVAMLRRLGIDAGAPLFIPGFGAFIMLKQQVDPLTDARIGLAGPVWGLGAALAALGVYAVTQARIWFAIAQLTAFMNLFNLIPIWQLDGSRGFHALSRPQRWTVVAVVALALILTGQRMLLIVGAVAVWQAVQREEGPGDGRALTTFVALVFVLSFLARGVG
jgi:Zn-dependent protease